MKRRVVVTGLGAVTPIGNDMESFWNGGERRKSRNRADHPF
ncbi:MAG: beta-ketoacyl synthase N-terminal-like domain-containing protein [Ruminococcus sp.]